MRTTPRPAFVHRATGQKPPRADRPPATELLPPDAVAWLVNNHNAMEQGWVFVGAWLFADRADDAVTMEDPAALVKWVEQTFTDLLPLWTSVYRET